jgi:anti-sigma factor RsiW
MSKYRYCKRYMVGFIDGQLTPKVRRRVARYIDNCPDCYREYIRQRDLQNELKAHFALVSQPDTVQLSRMWRGVQSEMHYTSSRRFRLRYGVLTAIVVLALMFAPLLFGEDTALPAAATQPTPLIVDTRVTDTAQEPVPTATVDSTQVVDGIVPEAARTPDETRTYGYNS